MPKYIDSAGTVWPFRIPITVVNVGGAGVIDISGPFPDDFDHFWANVDSAGDDIRITEANGRDLIAAATGRCTGWDLGAVAFSVPTRTFTLRIDGWTGATATTDLAHLLWLHYGVAGATSAVDGTVTLSAPETALYSDDLKDSYPLRFGGGVERFGVDSVQDRFQKAPSDKRRVCWDFDAQLLKRRRASGDSKELESIETFAVTAGQGGVSVPAVISPTATRMIAGNAVTTLHDSGTSGQVYWLEGKATTTRGRTLVKRVGMRVQDITE